MWHQQLIVCKFDFKVIPTETQFSTELMVILDLQCKISLQWPLFLGPSFHWNNVNTRDPPTMMLVDKLQFNSLAGQSILD